MARNKINVYGVGTLKYRKDKKRWVIIGHRINAKGETKRPQEYLPVDYTAAMAQAEYDRRATAHKAMQTGAHRPAAKNVDALCTAFLRDAEAVYTVDGKTASHWSTYKSAADQWKAMQGRLILEKYTGADLRGFRAALDARGKCTRGGVNKLIWAVTRVVKWGVDNGYASPLLLATIKAVDPLRKGQAKSAEGKGRKACTATQVDALENVLAPWWYNALLIGRWTGARPAEYLERRAREVDTSGDVWCIVPEKHKTQDHGVVRKIYLPKPAREALEAEMRGLKPDDFIFSPKRWAARDRKRLHRSPESVREVADEADFRRAILRACKSADVKRFTPYQLCHLRENEINAALGKEHARANRQHSTAKQTDDYIKESQAAINDRLALAAAMVGVGD